MTNLEHYGWHECWSQRCEFCGNWHVRGSLALCYEN